MQGPEEEGAMAAWTSAELDGISADEEVRIAARRGDGELRTPVIVWLVRHGDRLFLRSVKGTDGAWFQATRERHDGRLWAGGVERDVVFVDADSSVDDDVDAAYAAKYGADNPDVHAINAPGARATTMELVPR
jgi:hypothetical protein